MNLEKQVEGIVAGYAKDSPDNPTPLSLEFDEYYASIYGQPSPGYSEALVDQLGTITAYKFKVLRLLEAYVEPEESPRLEDFDKLFSHNMRNREKIVNHYSEKCSLSSTSAENLRGALLLDRFLVLQSDRSIEQKVEELGVSREYVLFMISGLKKAGLYTQRRATESELYKLLENWGLDNAEEFNNIDTRHAIIDRGSEILELSPSLRSYLLTYLKPGLLREVVLAPDSQSLARSLNTTVQKASQIRSIYNRAGLLYRHNDVSEIKQKILSEVFPGLTEFDSLLINHNMHLKLSEALAYRLPNSSLKSGLGRALYAPNFPILADNSISLKDKIKALGIGRSEVTYMLRALKCAQIYSPQYNKQARLNKTRPIKLSGVLAASSEIRGRDESELISHLAEDYANRLSLDYQEISHRYHMPIAEIKDRLGANALFIPNSTAVKLNYKLFLNELLAHSKVDTRLRKLSRRFGLNKGLSEGILRRVTSTLDKIEANFNSEHETEYSLGKIVSEIMGSAPICPGDYVHHLNRNLFIVVDELRKYSGSELSIDEGINLVRVFSDDERLEILEKQFLKKLKQGELRLEATSFSDLVHYLNNSKRREIIETLRLQNPLLWMLSKPPRFTQAI